MEWWSAIVEFFQIAVNPESIIKYGGLWLLFTVIFVETGLLVGFFLPGDGLLFTAGLLAADPHLAPDTAGMFEFSYWSVLFFISIAAITGDSLGYYIGSRFGPKVFVRPRSRIFRPEYVQMTRVFFDKHGGKALVLGRFLPVIRTFAPVMAGVAGMRYTQFLRYNIVGGLIWVVSLVSLGYFLGTTYPAISHYYEWIIIGFIVITTIPLIRFYWKQRKEKRENPRSEKEVDALYAEEVAHIHALREREQNTRAHIK
ncbi:MAG: VTT domain-containing protein [Bacteroidetes bacterium]|nr:VTT domain-containing protein [Bacteroidota bacterium]